MDISMVGFDSTPMARDTMRLVPSFPYVEGSEAHELESHMSACLYC